MIAAAGGGFQRGWPSGSGSRPLRATGGHALQFLEAFKGDDADAAGGYCVLASDAVHLGKDPF
jgi:hypothetical protein